MKILITLFLTVVLVLSACKESEKPLIIHSNGIWEQLGYGKIFQIERDSVKIFDICEVGCNVFEHVPLRSQGKVESFSEDSLTLRKNMKTYKFIRLNALPSLCKKDKENFNSPVYNFEVLWNTINEQYSFFDIRKIDWSATYKKYKPQINEDVSELELYLIFEEMLNSLNDGHVSLSKPESLSDTLRLLNLLKKNKSSEKAKMGPFELGDLIFQYYCKEINKHNSGIVKWGMMKGDIAYLQINAMWLLAYYDLPQNLPLQEFYPLYGEEMDKRIAQREDEIKGADILMDTIISEIGNAKALVIDLRFNQGGKDEAALEFISHLVDKRLEIASKKARLGKGYTNHQVVFLDPKTPFFNKNVYVLTSGVTASAAELAVLATLPYNNFVRIGSNTEGIFSDGLDKTLPNGWDYKLSNEIYVDSEGRNYEGSGIPPDIDLNYPREKGAFLNLILNQIQSTGDEAIEKVFKLEIGN